MAASKARVGRGTTLGYDLTSPYTTIVPAAELVRIGAPELDAGQVESTHLTSDDNAKEFLPSGFIDYGMVEGTGNYYTDEIDTLLDIIEAQALVGWEIKIPDKKDGSGTDTKMTFTGFLKTLKPFDEATPDGNTPLRHSFSIKVSGKITYAPATAGS